ncbi:MAG TPA: hypothetical protein VK576_11750 [Thermoleophilia bacterium]|nr:hypothetical protein [Thermoleophilia bacterium]
MNLIRREPALLTLLATAAVVAGVALLAGGDAVAAAGGVLLAAVLWLLERLTVRLGERGSFSHGLMVGLLGMVLRVAIAIGVLAAVGVLADRATFTAFVLGFVTGYTVYLFIRLWRHPAVSPSH